VQFGSAGGNDAFVLDQFCPVTGVRCRVLKRGRSCQSHYTLLSALCVCVCVCAYRKSRARPFISVTAPPASVSTRQEF
jgi:hypothetical protein